MICEILGKMFGTDKAAASLINNASKAIDKIVYTDEEKADDKAKSVTEARLMVIKWMESTQGQNIARRSIALFVSSIWGTQYAAMMILSIVAVWVDNPEKYSESAKVIGGFAESMNGAMMLILAFYFAAPHMGSMVQGALDRFGKTK